MRDVAQAAGVSVMTVSRVINRQPGVLPETAARVEHAIRQLGYQRNDTARQLRRSGQPTQIIGMLVDDLANPFYATLVRAVEDAARRRHYVVLIGSSHDSLEREREVVAAFCARQVDGLILVPVAGSHRFLASELAQGTKVVCVDRPTAGLDVDRVAGRQPARRPGRGQHAAGPRPPAHRIPRRPARHLDHGRAVPGLPGRLRRARARARRAPRPARPAQPRRGGRGGDRPHGAARAADGTVHQQRPDEHGRDRQRAHRRASR